MKKIIFIIPFLVMACSKSGPNISEIPEVIDGPVHSLDISALAAGSLDVSVSDENVVFESLDQSKKESQVALKISNTSSSSIPLVWDDSGLLNGFFVKVNRCGSSLDAKKNCSLTLGFRSRGLYDGVKNGTFLLTSGSNSVSLNLSGSISGSPNPAVTGTANLQLEMGEPFEESGLPYREVKIKNIGDGIAKNIQTRLTEEYSIRLNRCPSDLAPGKECVIQILLKNWKYGAVAPEKIMLVSSESGVSNVVSEKQVVLTNGQAGNFIPVYTPVYAPLPPNDKTTECSGTSTYTQVTLSCTDYFGDSVATSNCAPGESITYYSPAGIASTENILHGSREYRCNLGSDQPYFHSGTCDNGFLYSEASEFGVCETTLQMSIASCENVYEGDNCQVDASSGVPPYVFSINTAAGSSIGSSTGILNPNFGSTIVTVTDSAGGTKSQTLSSTRKLYASCNDILTNVPSTAGQNGLYVIDGDGIRAGEGKFSAYCDMTNNSGGWTLLFSAKSLAGTSIGTTTAAAASHPIFNGTWTDLNSVSVTTSPAVSISHPALQAAVRTVKFRYLRMGESMPGARTMESSITTTTFVQKKTALISWVGASVSGAVACVNPGWNQDTNGNMYTNVRAFLSCRTFIPVAGTAAGNNYGDLNVLGLGITAVTAPAGSAAPCGSGNVTCGQYVALGYAFHRGISYIQNGAGLPIIYNTWVK